MRFLLILLILAACANSTEIRQNVSGIGAKYGLHEKIITTSQFKIFTLSRITSSELPIRFYIEGDGNSWRTKSMPSDDPTPARSVAFEVALADNYPNLVYVARPCQYALADPKCEEKFWTSGIYAPEAVTAINEVVKSFGGKAELIGHSGGAAIAILVAAQNENVVSLRTIAGNLDQKKFVEIHNLSPLTDSIDMDSAIPKLAHLPQIHFIGGDDSIITADIAKSYEAKLGTTNCSKTQIIPGNNHVKGWHEIWNESLKTPPSCNE